MLFQEYLDTSFSYCHLVKNLLEQLEKDTEFGAIAQLQKVCTSLICFVFLKAYI